MCASTFQDRILEAIDQLRQRKARPDIERISSYMLRRFAVDCALTKAELQRLVNSKVVVEVEYKGSLSYRNAAKWSRYHMHKTKQERNSIAEGAGLTIGSAVSELILEEPDYLELGVPVKELHLYLQEKDEKFTRKYLDSILQQEINARKLFKLSNGNISLIEQEPASPANSNSSNCYENGKSFDDNGDDDIIIKKEPKDENFNEKNNKLNEDDSMSTSASGFRVGNRQKRAKKVFDPSDNNIPVRKRGRPFGSTNKNKEAVLNAIKAEVSSGVCYICHQNCNKRGNFEKLVRCRDCVNKVHPSCVENCEVNPRSKQWQCMQCKACVVCFDSSETETMVVCGGCDEGYHLSCHTPVIVDKSRSNKWLCSTCSPSDYKSNGTLDAPSSSDSLRESPVPALGVSSYPSDSPSMLDDDGIDERIPDASNWTSEQVCSFLSEEGFPEEARKFKENDIDGASLLLMKREDVLKGLHLKLGPALKIYKRVKMLQMRRNDPWLLWS